MDLLLQALQKLPEFRQLLDTANAGGAAAATGLAQINRAHICLLYTSPSPRDS